MKRIIVTALLFFAACSEEIPKRINWDLEADRLIQCDMGPQVQNFRSAYDPEYDGDALVIYDTNTDSVVELWGEGINCIVILDDEP